MVVGGLQRFSLSDFPGLISAIVFTRGCSFRCPYCHNPELVDPSRFAPEIPLDEVRALLISRKGRLQGVVVTGGEPTIHADLPAFIAELRDMGYAVKLDTNGSNPRMLRHLIESGAVDFVAMDIKAPLARCSELVQAPAPPEDLQQSIDLILHSGIPHEFRTTFVESLLGLDDMRQIASLVKGCQKYVIQPFRSGKVLEAGLAVNERENEARLAEIARILIADGCSVEMR